MRRGTVARKKKKVSITERNRRLVQSMGEDLRCDDEGNVLKFEYNKRLKGYTVSPFKF